MDIASHVQLARRFEAWHRLVTSLANLALFSRWLYIARDKSTTFTVPEVPEVLVDSGFTVPEVPEVLVDPACHPYHLAQVDLQVQPVHKF